MAYLLYHQNLCNTICSSQNLQFIQVCECIVKYLKRKTEVLLLYDVEKFFAVSFFNYIITGVCSL